MVDESVSLLFEEGEEEEEKKEESNTVGFVLYYGMDVADQKRENFGWSKKKKGLFGGVWADIKNFRLKTLGGGEIPLGKLFDKNVYKNLAGVPDINGKTVTRNIQEIVRQDYPESSLHA